MNNTELLQILQNKLDEMGISVDIVNSKIVLDNTYQEIVKDYSITNMGQLSPIFEYVKADVTAGLGYENEYISIMIRYYWRHAQGGGNGYTVRETCNLKNNKNENN